MSLATEKTAARTLCRTDWMAYSSLIERTRRLYVGMNHHLSRNLSARLETRAGNVRNIFQLLRLLPASGKLNQSSCSARLCFQFLTIFR